MATPGRLRRGSALRRWTPRGRGGTRRRPSSGCGRRRRHRWRSAHWARRRPRRGRDGRWRWEIGRRSGYRKCRIVQARAVDGGRILRRSRHVEGRRCRFGGRLVRREPEPAVRAERGYVGNLGAAVWTSHIAQGRPPGGRVDPVCTRGRWRGGDEPLRAERPQRSRSFARSRRISRYSQIRLTIRPKAPYHSM